MTRNQLIKELRAKGITAVNGKKLTKCKAQPLQDYWDKNFLVETKADNNASAEIVPAPVSLEKTKPTDVDVDKLMQEAKASGEQREIKYTIWQKRILSLLQDVYKTEGKEEWIVPQSDIMSILGMTESSTAIKYAQDWRPATGQGPGVALWTLRYEASYSKRKGKEQVTIKEISKERQMELYANAKEQAQKKLKNPIR